MATKHKHTVTRTVTRGNEVQVVSARLTTAQRARVRELMVDEGQSREEATAWVRAFEPPAQ